MREKINKKPSARPTKASPSKSGSKFIPKSPRPSSSNGSAPPKRKRFDGAPPEHVSEQTQPFVPEKRNKPKTFDNAPDRPTGDRPAAGAPPRSKPPRSKSPQEHRSNDDRRRSDRPNKRPAAPELPVGAPVDIPAEPLPLFSELGLDETVLRAITDLGFESPTPIQAKAIPVLTAGRNLIGQAQTGTGKTAAFAIPLIAKIDPNSKLTQALVMVPTRELAVQVAGGIHDLAKHTDLRVAPVYGGQPIDRQFRALKMGAQIVVGTPGRILDHLRRGSLTLANVTFCALDEADEMMALGFAEDMDAILGQLPENCQLAFFSATMPPKIANLVKKYLGDAQHISIEPKRRTVESTNQTYYDVPKGKKLEALARVLDMETPGSSIVFCRTRQETNDLCEALRIRGYNAEALHGDMGQSERDRVMKRFRETQVDILVATDVAARGLDIDSVTHVINYDIPWDVEQYIHRIGRTGRAGRSGSAITLVEGKQRRQLETIERAIGTRIQPARIPTAADIAARRREVFRDAIREKLEANDFEAQLPTVEDLLEEFDATAVAAAALAMLWQMHHSDADGESQAEADFEQPELGMNRIFMSIGRQDGLRPGDVVGAIVGETGLSAKSIGVIDILDRTAFFEVPTSDAERVMEALSATMIRGKRVKLNLADGRSRR
jgi:ATP-dependent RNA helicase DeaD